MVAGAHVVFGAQVVAGAHVVFGAQVVAGAHVVEALRRPINPVRLGAQVVSGAHVVFGAQVVAGAHVVFGAQVVAGAHVVEALRRPANPVRLGAQVVSGAHVVFGAQVVAGAHVVAAPQPNATSEDCVAGVTPTNKKANPTIDKIVANNTTRRFMVTEPPEARAKFERNKNETVTTIQQRCTSKPCWCPPTAFNGRQHTSSTARSRCLHSEKNQV